MFVLLTPPSLNPPLWTPERSRTFAGFNPEPEPKPQPLSILAGAILVRKPLELWIILVFLLVRKPLTIRTIKGASFALSVFRRVKGHHNLLHHSPLTTSSNGWGLCPAWSPKVSSRAAHYIPFRPSPSPTVNIYHSPLLKKTCVRQVILY